MTYFKIFAFLIDDSRNYAVKIFWKEKVDFNFVNLP